MAKRKSDMIELQCQGCGKKEKFHACSPAARNLTASEESAKHGWSYKIGFFAMMTGDHENRCPECSHK